MAHVLIGWEFGSNRGHAVRVARIADVLRRRGHRVSFALQRVDGLTEAEVGGSDVWPAPVTPRLLVNSVKPKPMTPASMGDILARLGFDDATITASVLRAWRLLFRTIRPDLVIGDFAPFMLAAARGAVPTISSGNGFDTPPSAMPRFPSLTGAPPAVDEERTLETVRAAAREAGCKTIERLPQLFEASREIPGSFAELDPYREWRPAPMIAPSLPAPPPRLAARGGEEVFVYAPETLGSDALLWKALAASRLPIRTHVPRVSAAYHEELRRIGIQVEPKPLPFDEIADRSRLLVSHGGHGFVCSALLAGVPQVICHYDIEKLLHGRAVARLGLGGFAGLLEIDPAAFARSLVTLYQDEGLQRRSRDAAEGFARQHKRTMEESLMETVNSLL